MIKIYAIFLMLFLFSCTQEKPFTEVESDVKMDSNDLVAIPIELGNQPLPQFDSLRLRTVDTLTLARKRFEISKNFTELLRPSGPDYDTLFDINFDGYLDYIIGFYYQAGTGLKNGIEVYIYNAETDDYSKDSLLSDLTNPSFYLNEEMITEFYLGNGGGGGRQLEWIDSKWKITKEIRAASAADYLDSIYWRIDYPLAGKRDSILDLYRGVPRQDVLRNEYGVD